jgi:hypothetical protein
MAFWNILVSVLNFIGLAIYDWMKILVSPIFHLELMWIIIPIWLIWFFAEIFQEKKGTSFGNAISNGVVPVYVGIDWIRSLTNSMISENLSFTLTIFLKYFICFVAISYGLIVIIYGIKGREFIKYFGRIREVTYFLLIFTPVIYGVIDLTFRNIILMIIFFPAFYYSIELIDKLTPDPKAVQIDMGNNKKNDSLSSNSFNSSDSFNHPADSFNKEDPFNMERGF